MVKLRDARYCNIKLLMIFCVVYGHLIEPSIGQSEMLMIQYKLIYSVHMPLFCFLSGLFIKDERSCQMRLARMIPLYLICQAAAVLLGEGKVRWDTPYWHLWYLFSYIFWLCLAWIWFRFCKGKGKTAIVICSLIVGCLTGLDKSIGLSYSFSRSLTFLPYFASGLVCTPAVNWRRLRPIGVAALAFGITLFSCCNNTIPVGFLYQSAPYGGLENGLWLRFACYLIGGSISLFLLSFTPQIRFPFTKIGANTMPAYLMHAPMVLFLQDKALPWQMNVIITAVFLYITDLILHYFSNPYGIVTKKKGGITGDSLSKNLRRIRSTCVSLPVNPDR